jgi:hypothetical protein
MGCVKLNSSKSAGPPEPELTDRQPLDASPSERSKMAQARRCRQV